MIEAAVASVANAVVVVEVGGATLEVVVGVILAVEVAALNVETEVGSEVIEVGFEVTGADFEVIEAVVAEVAYKKSKSSRKAELSSC